MIKSLFNDPQELKKLYIDEHKSLTEIGYICGVAFQTVGKWLKKHGIKARSYGTKGTTYSKGRKYRKKDPNQPHWRTGKKLSPEHRKNVIASLKKNWVCGEKHPNWKGGSLSHGYKVISVNGKRISEHKYIMEQHLGRKISRKENIHHINGDKLDNRIENLMVLSAQEHSRLHWSTRDEIYKKAMVINLQRAKSLKNKQ